MNRSTLPVLFLCAAATACSDPGFDAASCKDSTFETCLEVSADDPDALQVAVNSLLDNTEIILGAGTFALDNQVTLRGASGVTLRGQSSELTILDFSKQEAQSNGVDVVGDDFAIADLTVQDAMKDGVRIEESNGVTIQRLNVTWSGGARSTNGAYGIYPVRSTNVLLEDSTVTYASDAGVYVGQCSNAIVRGNTAMHNVAGIEIENTQYADVYNNHTEDNSGGLVVFDLPGNPIVGRDVYIHDNTIINNNHPNFAPSGIVRSIPAGTGTFALASRRVEISGNTYDGNNTVDIALLNGLAIEGDAEAWALTTDSLIGDTDDLALMEGDGVVYNFRSEEIWVHSNSHGTSGTDVDISSLDLRPLGFLIGVVYGTTPVDHVIYGTIGESSFSATDASANSNDHHICVAGNTSGTFASLDIETLASRMDAGDFPSVDDLYRPAAPFAPFDCEGFTGGDLVDVELPE